jgi:iron complex transport system substrate-binding protein
MMMRAVPVVIVLLMAGVTDTFATSPSRVISLDYCADQFVLKLLPKDRILAVSPDARSKFSYMRDHALGVSQVRPIAEDVLTRSPDLVVRSYGGGSNITHFVTDVGVPVVQIPLVANDLDAIRESIRFVAEKLGVPARGEKIVADMNRRLKAINNHGDEKTALYMTPTGVTSGPGTLIHEMITAAGYQNFEERPGWWSLPLERLAYEQPDLVIAAFFDHKGDHPGQWSAMRHPVAKRQLSERPTVLIDGAWTSCGAWFLLDAIEALDKAPLSGEQL